MGREAPLSIAGWYSLGSSDDSRSLQDRWEVEPFRALGDGVVNRIRDGRPLEDLGLPTHHGRTDLRGLSFPRPRVLASSPLKVEGIGIPLRLERTEPRLVVKRRDLRHIDLSYGNASETSWHSCSFDDVLFTGACLRDVTFWSCRFQNCTFEGADLREAVLGGVAGSEPNEYARVSFVRADLRKSTHLYPLYRDCDFSNANLDDVRFDASRFTRCKFSGRLNGVWFWGRYEIPHPADVPYFAKRGIDPRSIVNPMEDVDFSDASLENCMFIFGIDLSRCRFPQDGAHIVLKDCLRTFDQMEQEIRASWTDPNRSEALGFLRREREDPRKAGQSIAVFHPEAWMRFEGPMKHLTTREREVLLDVTRWMKPFFELMRKYA